MNRLLTILLVLPMLAGLPVFPVQAAAPLADAEADLPLCLPGVYRTDPGDCLPLGPSTFITELAQRGISYPIRPLPAQKPDPALQYAPDAYLSVTSGAISMYATLEDAISGSPVQSLGAGLMKYLAIIQRVDRAEGIFYGLTSGLWVRAADIDASCCIRSGRFQGLLFADNPPNSFGWIVDQAVPRTAPGYLAPEKKMTLYRETVVQIFDVQTADNTKWYMIGLDTWVERRYIRQMVVNPTPPEGIDRNRWIEINLYEQTLAVYEDNRLVFATLIASGIDPFFTRPGLFQVYEKLEKTNMSGAFEPDRSDYYYLENVPYTLYFDEARAIHGAYWRTLFGYPQSHGCINLSIGDAAWIYSWADVGDWVYVWDPSGETPTDPKFYTSGGA
ncbi:MAG TPA: L,D-transpeptidase [Anaerolineaceae bacterium]|nr:L,D-transpeptidase [Anaerolineaceae bacterium]HQF45755.1 L,D-transpeptidase [Anaerolineaceae bacterium]HQH35335.1 L,D-transpeptidase [Anaerolineaceae bacterium]HQJ04005.1 L,D-transpeptidase [Anaerolineaceae bacterium]